MTEGWTVGRVTLKKGYAEVMLHSVNTKPARKAKVFFNYKTSRIGTSEVAWGLGSPRFTAQELRELKPKVMAAVALQRLTK